MLGLLLCVSRSLLWWVSGVGRLSMSARWWWGEEGSPKRNLGAHVEVETAGYEGPIPFVGDQSSTQGLFSREGGSSHANLDDFVGGLIPQDHHIRLCIHRMFSRPVCIRPFTASPFCENTVTQSDILCTWRESITENKKNQDFVSLDFPLLDFIPKLYFLCLNSLANRCLLFA